MIGLAERLAHIPIDFFCFPIRGSSPTVGNLFPHFCFFSVNKNALNGTIGPCVLTLKKRMQKSTKIKKLKRKKVGSVAIRTPDLEITWNFEKVTQPRKIFRFWSSIFNTFRSKPAKNVKLNVVRVSLNYPKQLSNPSNTVE